MKLYHVTSSKALSSIMADGGVKGPSYWCAWEELVDYYSETVEDEGEVPAVACVALDDLEEALLAPDVNSVAEPIMTAVRAALDLPRTADEESVAQMWAECEGTWRDSVAIVGSAVYRGEVPAGVLEIVAGPPHPRP